MWGELTYECRASCLRASLMWGELYWGELSLGRVVCNFGISLARLLELPTLPCIQSKYSIYEGNLSFLHSKLWHYLIYFIKSALNSIIAYFS